MKKLFYFMGVAAIMASCTQEEIVSENDFAPVQKGDEVVFSLGANATTRGTIVYDEQNLTSNTGWEAEIDEFGVVYSGVVKGAEDLEEGTWTNLAAALRKNTTNSAPGYAAVSDQALASRIATYKATRTGKQAYATAADRDNILYFVEDEPAAFRFFRPVGTSTVTYSKTAGNAAQNANVESMKVTVADFTEQIQETEKANFDNFFMVSDPVEGVNKYGEQGVGEAVNLSFGRAFSAMAIKLAGYDKNVYGKLNSITITASTLNIAASDATVDIAGQVGGEWPIAYANGSKSIVLTVGDGSGLVWDNNYYAYVQILPLNNTLSKVAKDETVTIAFDFDNYDVTFTKTLTKADADKFKQNTMSRFTCDLSKEPYLYANDRLIVNSAMPTIITDDKDPNVGNFMWSGNPIDPASITHFTSVKELTAADLAVIKEKYTGVTNFTLAKHAALGNDLVNITKSPENVVSLALTTDTEAPVISAVCANLSVISCPEVTTIPANAFKGNTVLTTAKFPKVVTIGENAFEGAVNITSIAKTNDAALQIGDALTTIGDRAFYGITGMTKIEAAGVTEIGYYGFGYSALTSLTSVKLPKYDFGGTTENNAYVKAALLASDNDDLETLDLSAVKEIGNKVVVNTLSALETVTLNPAGVVICDKAFEGLANLTTVNNLDKATAIGEAAFKDTKVGTAGTGVNAGVITVTLNPAITAISKDAFAGNTRMTKLVASGVTSIADGAFAGCTELDNIDLTNVATIGKGAFLNCAMTNITLSAATTIAENTFNGATGGLVTLDKVTSIAEGGLALSNTSTIMIKSVLTSIDPLAFGGSKGAQAGTKVAPILVESLPYNLIVNTAQSEVDGNSIKFSRVEKNNEGKDITVYYELQFTSIVKAF